MKNSKKHIITILLIMILLIVFFLVYLFKHARISSGTQNTVLAKKEDLNKVTIIKISEEGIVNNINKIDKNTVYVFWASWCIPCKKEIPAIYNLSKKYMIDLKFVSIDRNNDNQKELIQNELLKNKIYNTYLLDYKLGLDFNNEKAFGLFFKKLTDSDEAGIPKILLYNDKGDLVAFKTGYSREDSIGAYNSLDSLLNYYYK